MISDSFSVPGSILTVVERIIRSTIPSEDTQLVLNILEEDETILIRYQWEEVLRGGVEIEQLEDISRNYKFYSDKPVRILVKNADKIVELPKLKLDESSHY